MKVASNIWWDSGFFFAVSTYTWSTSKLFIMKHAAKMLLCTMLLLYTTIHNVISIVL